MKTLQRRSWFSSDLPRIADVHLSSLFSAVFSPSFPRRLWKKCLTIRLWRRWSRCLNGFPWFLFLAYSCGLTTPTWWNYVLVSFFLEYLFMESNSYWVSFFRGNQIRHWKGYEKLLSVQVYFLLDLLWINQAVNWCLTLWEYFDYLPVGFLSFQLFIWFFITSSSCYSYGAIFSAYLPMPQGYRTG